MYAYVYMYIISRFTHPFPEYAEADGGRKSLGLRICCNTLFCGICCKLCRDCDDTVPRGVRRFLDFFSHNGDSTYMSSLGVAAAICSVAQIGAAA